LGFVGCRLLAWVDLQTLATTCDVSNIVQILSFSIWDQAFSLALFLIFEDLVQYGLFCDATTLFYVVWPLTLLVEIGSLHIWFLH
jgi:hypothetical protein